MSAKRFIPLTPKQRGYLAQLAKQAHAFLTSKGAIDEPFEKWRHREAMDATSGFTISEAPKRCFDDLETRFLALAGKPAKAFERASGPANDERNLTHNIATAARECGANESYIAGICRRMFHGRETWQGVKEGKAVLVALKNKLRTQQRKANAEQGTSNIEH